MKHKTNKLFINNYINHCFQKSKKILSRGEELLEMIKLDVMEWSLLECSPISYEDFIRSYGKLNAQQVPLLLKNHKNLKVLITKFIFRRPRKPVKITLI